MPVEPGNILHRVDSVWNALHGTYGADGKVQKILERFGAAHTGPSAFAAAVASSPELRAKAYRTAGLRSAQAKKIMLDRPAEELANVLFRSFPMPLHLSVPGLSGPALFISGFPALSAALQAAAEDGEEALIAEHISGPQAACIVIDDFRGEKHYALLPIEFHETGDRHPGAFTRENKAEIERMAREAHQALGLKDYSKSYFAVHKGRGPVLLETSSLPPLHEGSRLEHALQAVGSSMKEFAMHTIGRTLK